ncbi:acidic repeat-containing protein isoform X2 [Vespa crabro]|uniref:acidic repeat-containing protein isoform X2 n=1 Tax=Vespa crabro TaxID=7445 RepID=UPI001EFFC6AA|nr:acidic repeat-containing protein isoform X2 [Vespa crabro]
MSDFSDDSFSLSVDKQKYKKVVYQILPKVSNRMDINMKDILKVTIIGSQDFSLKLTDNSVIEDTQDIFPDNNERSTNENDAIVISDSSFDHSLDYFDKKKIISPIVSKGTYKSIIRSKNYSLEISNDTDEDRSFTEKWRNVSVRNNDFNKFSNRIKITISQDKNSFYTSDDSSKKNSTSSSEYNKNTNVSKDKYVSPTPTNKQRNDEKSNKQIQNISEKKENIYTPVKNLNLLNKLTNNNSNSSNSNTNDSKKSETCIQMKKGDLTKILKNIQLTKAVYESPKTKKTNDAVIDETLDDKIHPALLSDDSLIKKSKLPARIIDETPSNSDIIRNQSTEINTVTSPKIHDQSVDSPIDNQVKTLSERKKKEISNWLMTGLPRSHSDNSSFNNVPASNKDSISSGNSSLERLELNYETPNNRGKIEFKNIDNYITSVNARTSPSHKFLEKPDPPTFSKILQKNDQYENEDKKEFNNMNVIQCTDILDKLYGQVWRDKAGDLLSTPTKKQSVVMERDRTIQRDRDIKIYDSDTKDKCNTNSTVQKVLDKKISSSNNEESSSDTSEFDPGDDVTEKRMRKRGTYIKQNPTTTTTNKNHLPSIESKKKETYSFLASLSHSVPLTNAHPDAKKYRQSYKKNKEELCKYLYKLYNENIFDKMLPENMIIQWNVRMREVAGYCYNSSYVIPQGGICRTSTIELSTKVLDAPNRLRDTLIHEMCHAACWIINGESSGHGYLWTAWANRATNVFPELPPIRRFHDYAINTKYMYKCTGCGLSIGRHSKSVDIENKRCDCCNGKLELFVNKSTKSGTVQMQTPQREPSAFALYVKENYKSVKKDKNLNHAEVMKLLGKNFSAIKIAKKDDDNNADNDKDSFD